MQSLFLKIYVVGLLLSASIQSNIFLQAPQHISDDQIEEAIKNWQTTFYWRFTKGCFLTLDYKAQQASVMLSVGSVPIRSYNFKYVDSIKRFLFEKNTMPNYFLDEPLMIPDNHPIKIESSMVPELLAGKRFIFYTGAGISASSNVLTMNSLEKSLCMADGNWLFLKTMFLNPQVLTSAFESFCKSCIDAQPTPAHMAVHTITQRTSSAIVTENVDLLQQKTHSCPVHAECTALHEAVACDLKDVDVVICVGLSHDDRGFLGCFKKNNPKGIIIALDIGQPNYLSDTDYLVQEDLQIVLPQLANTLVNEITV